VAVASALVLVSGASCGRSAHDGTSEPVRVLLPTPPSWAASAESPTEREDVLELHLDEVRRALTEGRTRRAGELLAAALRELESDSRSRVALDPRAAATFEAVRRTADRWQAGVRSGAEEQRSVLQRLEEEAHRLLGPA
jgi:hypothetical protein